MARSARVSNRQQQRGRDAGLGTVAAGPRRVWQAPRRASAPRPAGARCRRRRGRAGARPGIGAAGAHGVHRAAGGAGAARHAAHGAREARARRAAHHGHRVRLPLGRARAAPRQPRPPVPPPLLGHDMRGRDTRRSSLTYCSRPSPVRPCQAPLWLQARRTWAGVWPCCSWRPPGWWLPHGLPTHACPRWQDCHMHARAARRAGLQPAAAVGPSAAHGQDLENAECGEGARARWTRPGSTSCWWATAWAWSCTGTTPRCP